jgi:hypothetical protein
MDSADLRPRLLIRDGAILLALAAIVDVAVEYGRAQASLRGWICRGNSPIPAGPQVCELAFLLRWMTARLPVYVLGVGAAGLIASAVVAARRRVLAGFDWSRLVRFVGLVVGLIALSELVACAGDASCGLSLTCT